MCILYTIVHVLYIFCWQLKPEELPKRWHSSVSPSNAATHLNHFDKQCVSKITNFDRYSTTPIALSAKQVVEFTLPNFNCWSPFIVYRDLVFINCQLMSALTSLERFGDEDPFFINWRSYKHCLQSEWPLLFWLGFCRNSGLNY